MSNVQCKHWLKEIGPNLECEFVADVLPNMLNNVSFIAEGWNVNL
ncbi:hypothetical protein LINGRAHAP2_LOCUS20961 [Linum grandiflorum]